jgi:hypothetical protein
MKWPPLDYGTRVITTGPNPDVDDWTDEALKKRRWGVSGSIIKHHDSHGLCYEVMHDDGTIGCYDPSEFQVDNQGV